MAIAKGLMKIVVDAVKWFSCISKKRTFKEIEEEAEAREEHNMQDAEQEQRKRARRDDGSFCHQTAQNRDMDDGALISTPELQWSPIQFPITGGRQLLKRMSSSYMPLRMTRQRTSSGSLLVNKKSIEIEKRGVLLAYELLVPQQSRELACKILEHCEEKSSAQIKSNDDCLTSSRSSEPLALTIKENTMPVSSSVTNAAESIAVTTNILTTQSQEAFEGKKIVEGNEKLPSTSNGIEYVAIQCSDLIFTTVDTALHVLDSPILPKKMKGFRMDISDMCLAPERKGFRMCLSEESDDEDEESDDEDRESDNEDHANNYATKGSTLHCLNESEDDDYIRNNTTGSSAPHCFDKPDDDDHVNHDATRALHKSDDDHHVINNGTGGSPVHCFDVQNKADSISRLIVRECEWGVISDDQVYDSDGWPVPNALSEPWK